MLPNEVLEDICWSLARRDFEALLLTGHACVVIDNFASTGPLRSISRATLNDESLKCQSGDEERVIENPKDYGLCLRSTIVYQLAFDCINELGAADVESLKAVKGKYLLENLQMREYGMGTGAALAMLKDDVFACKKLSYEFDYDPFYDETDEEGDADAGSGRAEESKNVPKTLRLRSLPPCDAELIAEWLHSANGQPRGMEIGWVWCGEDELDSLKLVNILKQRFMEDTSPQRYVFHAGAERFEPYKVESVSLENSCGEFLKVKSIQTCYSDVRITRGPKDDASRDDITSSTKRLFSVGHPVVAAMPSL